MHICPKRALAESGLKESKVIIQKENKGKIAILDLGNVVVNWDVEAIVASLDQKEEINELLKKELFYHQDWLEIDHGLKTDDEVIHNVCERTGLSAELLTKAFVAK